tara:strand:- start:7824 stop:8543 length:720 start_codon:yes stop_codon:yes gene_type:complete
MCGAVLGFFGSLFSNESDYIKAQMDMEMRMAQERQRMYEERAKSEVLAMEQQMNALKDDANKKRKKNIAAFASSGLDINSPSYGAFLKENERLLGKDLRNARLQGIERAQNAMFGARQSIMEGQAAQIEGSAKLAARRTRLIGQAGEAIGEVASFGMDAYQFSKTGTWSDIRLKENIEFVKTDLNTGLNIYNFNYIGNSNRYQGVIAQEVINKYPSAVVVQNNLYKVLYDKLNINFRHI